MTEPAESFPPASASSDGSGPDASPGGASALIEEVSKTVQERPELGVAGAFAGGFLLALILKRIAR